MWQLHGRLLAPTRWLALVPGLTAACLSSDSHLLITTGARLQEVKTSQVTRPSCEPCARLQEVLRSNLLPAHSVQVALREPRLRDPVALRQVHLGPGLLLDPVTELLETPSMAIVAVTR